MTQPTDMELLDAFLSQDDRLTHSGMMLSDCFAPSQFDLVFEYGTVIQKSAVRQALIACISLPVVEPGAETPPRNATFEKHLENSTAARPAQHCGGRMGSASGACCRQFAGRGRGYQETAAPWSACACTVRRAVSGTGCSDSEVPGAD